jgi:RNA 2',3'-cyclic 3'-phosphodiesterase
MSRRATARLFVAAEVPAPVREQLARWARGAAAAQSEGCASPLRLLDREDLHLTLCFLGSRPIGEIAAIGSTLGACATGVGELSVGAPLWLPRSRPRSLAVAIHDEGGELADLHTAVTAAIRQRTGWEPERRRFRAHVTVARTRGRAQAGSQAPRRAGVGICLPATPQLRFTTESLILYRSWLSPSGAAYEAVAMCGLSPSAP